MKVKELIEQLQKLDQEKDVLCIDTASNPINGDGCPLKEVFEIKGSYSNDCVFLMEN